MDAKSVGRGQVLHIERAAFIPGQVTDAGHQANISLSSKINKPECLRNICSCFSEAITKISQEKHLVLQKFANVERNNFTQSKKT